MELDINDLPEQFIDVANKIGIDNMKIVFESFGGSSIYFPTKKRLYKEVRDRQIIKEYNKFNSKELALKYEISENYVKNIIKNKSTI